MKLKGFLLLVTVAVVGAALWPAAGGAARFNGVVVAKEHGALLVASPAGVVSAVSGRASVGARVAVGGGHAAVVGRATTARIRGIVVRSVGTTLFISSNRHLLALHTMRRLADTTPTTAPAPAPGTIVFAQVGIANGQLDEQDENDVGQVANGSISVQATVAGVAAGSVTLTVQGQTLTVPLPAGLTLPASLIGQTVTIQLSVGGGDNQGDDNSGNNEGGDGGGDG